MQIGFDVAQRRRKWVLRAFLLAIAWGFAAPAPAEAQTVAPGDGEDGRALTLPRVLSASDAARYRRIFDLQGSGDWHAAGHEIENIEDPILMGHVLAQRYLHPTRYRSKFVELRAWLKEYADHPQARRIHKLAMRRKPKSARPPRGPVAPTQPGLVEQKAAPGYISPRKRSKAQRRKLINQIAHIRAHLRRGDPAGAGKHLARRDFRVLADDVEFDIMRREAAHGYFIRGDDAKAFELAAASAARSGESVPLADWTAGLAAFRLSDLGAARRHFEALALAGKAPERSIAAAAYWAARVNLIARRPQRVSRFLAIAATYPRTFHGLLAHRALGSKPEFSWTLPPFSERDMATLSGVPAALRALALAQIGEVGRAEGELRRLRAGADPALDKAMLALATLLELPAAQLRIGRALAAVNGQQYDGAMYPIPRWTPAGGYRVDRALLFAMIHQESQFKTRAKSRAGARGLMQLMPSTASFVARDSGYRTRHRNDLYKPAINIDLGQKYLLYLLDLPEVRGNLLYLVAAYNGGPGNLRKWDRRNRFKHDPLLFIETVPVRETRLFVERVLTNLWLYRARLGQASPSLEAVAAGRWPTYVPQDSDPPAGDAGN